MRCIAIGITAWSASSLLLLHAAQRFEAVEPHMGTLVRITVYAPDAGAAQSAFQRGFERIRELDRKLSDYDPDSELMRLSRSEGPVRVSEDLYRVLEIAQRVSAASDGAFDVTMGPAVRLWREARRSGRLPTEAERAEALARTGHRYLKLDRGLRTVELGKRGMLLDLGGIAKGFAGDEALRAVGLAQAMVAVSGDLAIGDPPPGRSGWRVNISGNLRELKNCGVSTSGDESQFVEIGGIRYSHIVDPRTGLGLPNSKAVTAIAPNAALSDALATARSVGMVDLRGFPGVTFLP